MKLNLSLPFPDSPNLVGTLGWMFFTCDDIQKTYEELTARGVEFTDPPSEQFGGWWAVFKDPDGHLFGMGQRRE